MANEDIFPLIWAYTTQAQRAETRCRHIAEDEAVLGYEESAKLYETLSFEMKESYVYVEEILRSLLVPLS